MTDYNLGKVVGTDGVGIKSISSTTQIDGNVKVIIELTDDSTPKSFIVSKGSKGDTGVGIRNITLVKTEGVVKTYRITFTDNTYYEYTVKDGADAVCDDELDIDSVNAVENKVITGALNNIDSILDTKLDKNAVLQLLIDYGLVRTSDTANSVILSSDKSILSYADGESATLSATVYDKDNNVVPNKKVVFYKDEVVLDTRYTDANGVATYEYLSEGVGDVRFEASVGNLLSETYSITDAIYYNHNTLTSSQVLNIPDITTNFKASWILKKTNSSTSSWLEIGTDNNNLFFAGQIGSTGIGSFKKENGVNTGLNTINNVISSMNTEYLIELSYVDGQIKVKCNNQTSTANYNYSDRDYIAVHIDNNQMKDLMILPL